MIISRYLIKEILATLLAVTLVLLLLFLSNQLVRFLSYAASGKMAANILMQLMGFEIPYLLALLLPLGLYLGIIVAYGRLYADNEIRVMHACGLSVKRLVKITCSLSFVVSFVVLILSLWINPWIMAEKDKLIQRGMATDNILERVIPGRFQVSPDGSRVVYVEQVTRNHKRANNVFLADRTLKKSDDNSAPWTVVSAAYGSQITDPIDKNHFMVATNGYRYEGMPGQNDYKIIQFKKYAVRLPAMEMDTSHPPEESIPTHKLYSDKGNVLNSAELQWRISMPLSAFLLGLLAIPLSQIPPRRGRYAQLFPAVLLYIIYVNGMFIARSWVEQKLISTTLGMWWVHGVFLLLALVGILIQSGWIRQRS